MGYDVSEDGSSSNSNIVDPLTSKEQRQTRNSSYFSMGHYWKVTPTLEQ